MHGALLFARTGKDGISIPEWPEMLRADQRREPRFSCQFLPHRSCQSYFTFKAIDQMKRPQKSFSVEIKKSRTQAQRPHLPPRRLFAAPPDAISAVIQTAEPQAIPEPVTAPRILPSIIEPVLNDPEPIEPVRRKRTARSKADEGQIELDLQADGMKELEDVPDARPTPETALQMDDAPVAEESPQPVPEVRIDDVATGEKQARARRKKLPEFVEPVELPQTASRPSPAPIDSFDRSATVRSPKAVPARLTKRLAEAAQLPRHKRWKRRLHPATW